MRINDNRGNGKWGHMRRKEMGNEDIWEETKWKMRTYEKKGDGKWGYMRREEMGNEDIWEERKW